jgi:hypothetical protein
MICQFNLIGKTSKGSKASTKAPYVSSQLYLYTETCQTHFVKLIIPNMQFDPIGILHKFLNFIDIALKALFTRDILAHNIEIKRHFDKNIFFFKIL